MQKPGSMSSSPSQLYLNAQLVRPAVVLLIAGFLPVSYHRRSASGRRAGRVAAARFAPFCGEAGNSHAAFRQICGCRVLAAAAIVAAIESVQAAAAIAAPLVGDVVAAPLAVHFVSPPADFVGRLPVGRPLLCRMLVGRLLGTLGEEPHHVGEGCGLLTC